MSQSYSPIILHYGAKGADAKCLLDWGVGRETDSQGEVSKNSLTLHRPPGHQWVSLDLHQLFCKCVNGYQ